MTSLRKSRLINSELKKQAGITNVFLTINYNYSHETNNTERNDTSG